MSDLRRWVAAIALGLVAAAVCVTAGVWQWQRHAARSAQATVVTEHLVAEPSAILSPGQEIGPDRLWEPVALTGRYLGEPILLRNRPVASQPAFHVLGVVQVTQGPGAGTVLVVARGWVPAGPDAAAPTSVPAAPTGEIDLVVRLRPQESASTRTAPPGQVQTVRVDQVRDVALTDAGVTTTDWPQGAAVLGYGVVIAEDGVAPEALGRLPAPDTDLGPHLSYALQWWVFALGALVGPGVLVARERREQAVTGAIDGPAVPAPARSIRRRPSAEEEEDAILDAQEV